MGNSVSWNIILNHETADQQLAIVAGNTLEGQVVADVSQRMSPGKIELYLLGKEKTMCYRKTGKNSYSGTRGERIIVSARLTLKERGNDPIRPGVYTFPFRINLPNSIPSSMNGDGRSGSVSTAHRRSWWKIQYKLIVAMNGTHCQSGGGKRLFTVASQPLPNEQIPMMIEPNFHRVESLGFGQGTFAVGAKVLDAHVGRGTDLQLFLATRNDAAVDIERVKVKLLEIVNWSANRSTSSSTRELLVLRDVDVPGILRGKLSRSELRQTREMGPNGDTLFAIYQDLEHGSNLVTIKVPMACRDTYKSSLVNIHHCLEITLMTKSLVSNPKVRLPLKIGFPPSGNGRQRRPPPPPSAPPRATATSVPQPPAQPIAVVTSAPRPPSSSSAPYAMPSSSSSMPVIYSQSCIPVLGDTTDLPMANAVLVSTEGAVQAPMASAPTEAFVLGGTAVFSERFDSLQDLVGDDDMPPVGEEDPEIAYYPNEDVEMPVAQSLEVNETPSIESLLLEMTYSVYDFAIVGDKLRDAAWSDLLGSISAEQYGTILAHVNMDIDQPRVAVILANNLGPRFTCEYCIAAARNAADGSRALTVQRLLPYCVNLQHQHSSIRAVLNEWEQLVCERDFDRAIQARGGIERVMIHP